MINIASAHTKSAVIENIWLAWNFDYSLIFIAIITYFYFIGQKKYRKNYSANNCFFFLCGILFLILGLCSPIDYLAENYFLFHMIQHLLIIMLAAPSILLGAPSIPVITGINKKFPVFTKKLLRWKLYRKTLKFLTKPLVAILLYLISFWLWHLPFFYNAALASELIHYFQHFNYFVFALLLWWSIIDPRPQKSKFFFLLRILWVFLLTIANSALSAMIVFAPHAYYNYRKLEKTLVLSALDDQKIGGLIMWVGGNMMLIIIAILVFGVYYNKMTKKHKP